MSTCKAKETSTALRSKTEFSKQADKILSL